MARQRDSQAATALDLVGRAYEAACQPDLWPGFLNAFADATDCEGSIIWLHDFADASARLQGTDISFASHVRVAPDLMESYARHYTYTNVWMRSINALPEGEVADSSSVYPESQLRRSEFYADWLRPQGIGYALGGSILKRGSVVSMFSLLRPERRGPYEARDLRLMQLLMPHLRRACLLHQRLARLQAERSGGLAALELLPTAVWLLDAVGRLLFANRAGRELDQCHDGLWVDRSGVPVADDPAERQTLQRCIAVTIEAGSGLGVAADSALSVRRRRQAMPLQVMLYPLGSDAMLHGSAAAMFIFDPAKTVLPDSDVLRTLYGLTPAEARLVSALAQGATLEEYGGTHRLSANTVRTHVKRALAKTGAHRQAQLVSLVARLPAANRRVP